MKTPLFLLLSIFLLKDAAAEKENRIKESILNAVEEIGAWLLLGGFAYGIFWIIGVLFGEQMS
ncbi:MAG TPA: hypothetical protein VE978_18900 [Chitinophagales bacterium]|nr:hypothetical protein [Chitinophagales bacterium]